MVIKKSTICAIALSLLPYVFSGCAANKQVYTGMLIESGQRGEIIQDVYCNSKGVTRVRKNPDYCGDSDIGRYGCNVDVEFYGIRCNSELKQYWQCVNVGTGEVLKPKKQ